MGYHSGCCYFAVLRKVCKDPCPSHYLAWVIRVLCLALRPDVIFAPGLSLVVARTQTRTPRLCR
jgi:hypothetical protein